MVAIEDAAQSMHVFEFADTDTFHGGCNALLQLQ